MPTQIREESKEYLEILFRKEFNQINWSMEWVYNKADKLYKAMEDYGFNDLLEELKKDI